MKRFVPLVLAPFALLAACAPERISASTERAIACELRRAAAEGYPARVVSSESDDLAPMVARLERELGTETTAIVVGPRSAVVLPARKFADFTRSGFGDYLFRVWIRPYLAEDDPEGAVRGATRGYVRALQDNGRIARLPPYPPVPAPNRFRLSFPSAYVAGGWVLSVVVFGLALALGRAARRPAVSARFLAPNLTWLPPLGVAAVAALVLARGVHTLDHDAAMYMACAARLLSGARPYVDLVEVNPPLAWVVYGIPELVARTLSRVGIGVAPSFHLVVLACALGGALVARRWVRPDLRVGFVTACLLVQLAALVVPFRPFWLETWVSLPLAAWGQREHLFVIAVTAWFAVRAARERGRVPGPRAAAAIGMVTGCTAALKPHFFALIVAVEVLVSVPAWLRARSIRFPKTPEVLGLFVVPALYAVQFLFWPAEWRSAAFGRWLPLIRRTYGPAYDLPAAQLARHLMPAVIVVAAAFLTFAAARRMERLAGSDVAPASRDPLVLRTLALSVFGLGMAIVQAKGFAYHLLPAQAGALLSMGLIAPSFRSRGAFIGSATGVGALLVAGFSALLPLHRLGDRFMQPLEHALDALRLPAGSRVLVLNDAVLGPWPTLRLRGLAQSGRFPWLFPLPLARRLPAGTERDAEENHLARDLAFDMRHEPPLAIFALAEPMQALAPGLDWKPWLERHAPTKDALAAFEEPERVGPWWVYRARR